MVSLKECEICGLKEKQKNLRRINGSWICKKCYSKKRKDRREFIKRNVAGIRRREEILKEARKKREQKQNIPHIKNSKDKSINKRRNPYKGIWLTKEEKKVIYFKYKDKSSKFINKKYNEIKNQFENLINQWRKEKINEEEMDLRFKEHFAQLTAQ